MRPDGSVTSKSAPNATSVRPDEPPAWVRWFVEAVDGGRSAEAERLLRFVTGDDVRRAWDSDQLTLGATVWALAIVEPAATP